MISVTQRISDLLWGVYGQHAWDSAAGSSTLDLINKLSALLVQLRKQPDELVLDAGCGTGRFAVAFADAGFCVIGIDSAAGMIRAAKEKISVQHTQRLVFQQVSLSDTLPYNDATFDHIVCVSVLQLLRNPLSALRELTRILKPQGDLTVVHFPRPNHGHRCSVSDTVRIAPRPGPTLPILLRNLKSFLERVGSGRGFSYEELRHLVDQVDLKVVIEERDSPIVVVAVRQ